MEQDGPKSIYHSRLTNCINKQTFKNACDRIKVSNKILSLANAVFFFFLFWYMSDILYISFLKIVFFLSALPTLVLLEELLFCAS